MYLNTTKLCRLTLIWDRNMNVKTKVKRVMSLQFTEPVLRCYNSIYEYEKVCTG